MGFTRISEETSEIVFLLVENYQIDCFKRALPHAWEFLKHYCLNSLTLESSSLNLILRWATSVTLEYLESFHYLLPMSVALREEITLR